MKFLLVVLIFFLQANIIIAHQVLFLGNNHIEISPERYVDICIKKDGTAYSISASGKDININNNIKGDTEYSSIIYKNINQNGFDITIVLIRGLMMTFYAYVENNEIKI